MKHPSIAVVAPMSGPHAAFGEQVRTGVCAALAAVNAQRPSPIAFTAAFFDDECEVEKAVSIARNLALQRPLAVIGHVCSNTSVAASDHYAQAHIPMLTPASSSESLTARGLASVFRIAAREGAQALAIAEYIRRHHPHAAVAIIREDDYSATGHANRVAEALTRRGVRVMPEMMANESNLDILATSISTQSPDVVFYGGHHAALFGRLISTIRTAGYTGAIFSNDGAQQSEVWHAARGHAEGVIYAFERDCRGLDSAKQAVRHIEDTGANVEGFMLNAYACVELLTQAFDLAHNPIDRSAPIATITDALHSGTFSTSRGTIRFDAAGEMLDAPSALFVWRSGMRVPLPS